ncbi:MAG: Kdo hydroxylase family protein [Deltaproteobacteria bacterium]|nr:Kdo hydroxylase family protein [Deltaproteobacteria bacterium]
MRLPALFPVDPAAIQNGATAGDDLARRLEEGHILFFPKVPFQLPSEPDLDFLRTDLAKMLALKNISYHPPEDMLSGIKGDRAAKERTRAILKEHSAHVRGFLGRVLPRYAEGWSLGKVNWRPIEEHGRPLSRHASNEFIHVDAFPSGATHGARVLRFFTNVNPSEVRVWRSSGTFQELYEDFRERAGLAAIDGARIAEGPFARAFSGVLRGVKKLGVPTELVDTSPYDRAMKKLHDYLKDSDEFQQDARRHLDLEFPPFTSWAVLTDGVSHACLRGQHALVNTFYIPLSHAAAPELSPLHLMRSATAKTRSAA